MRQSIQYHLVHPVYCILHENDHLNGELFIDKMDRRNLTQLQPRIERGYAGSPWVQVIEYSTFDVHLVAAPGF